MPRVLPGRRRWGRFPKPELVVPVAVPTSATPGSRPDIDLLDATAVHVDLGERAGHAVITRK